MKKNVIIEIISGLLAILFMYASLSKLLNYTTFRLQVSASPVINQFAAIVWILPVVEIMITAMLAVNYTRKYGLYASAFLLVLFTGYICCMLVFVEHLPCSCGGVLTKLTWKQHILFNMFFLSSCIVGIVLEKKENMITHDYLL